MEVVRLASPIILAPWIGSALNLCNGINLSEPRDTFPKEHVRSQEGVIRVRFYSIEHGDNLAAYLQPPYQGAWQVRTDAR